MSCSDADDRDETKRQSRNTNEKKRRDQFNVLVNELARLVGGGGRKMDKSAVLRSTIGFLRAHNETSARSRDEDAREEWKPSFLTNDEFTQLMLEGLDAFILAFNNLGKILYVSENVASLLSLLPEDVLFQSLYELMPADQSAALYDLLSRGEPLPQDGAERGRFSVMLHLRRGGGGAPQYELVQLAGHVHQSAAGVPGMTGAADHSGAVYIGICRLQACQLVRELTPAPSDSGRREFSSRHSLEWKFLFLDHRASHLIGYSAMEVLGTSVYDYYHGDDLHGVADCHEQLMRVGQGTSCFYRFLTKGQKWLWLQTKYYITYHQWNSKPEFIVCTHSAVSLAEVRAQQPRPRCATPQPAPAPTPAPPLLTDADPLWSPTVRGPALATAASPCASYEPASPADSLYLSSAAGDAAAGGALCKSEGVPSPLGLHSVQVTPQPQPPPPPPPPPPHPPERQQQQQHAEQQRQQRHHQQYQQQQQQQYRQQQQQQPQPPQPQQQLAISPERSPVPHTQRDMQDSLLWKHHQLQQKICQQQQELAQINQLLLANCSVVLPPAARPAAPPQRVLLAAPAAVGPRYSMVDLGSLMPPRTGGLLLAAPASAAATTQASLSRVLLSAPTTQRAGASPPEVLFQLPLPPARGPDRPAR